MSCPGSPQSPQRIYGSPRSLPSTPEGYHSGLSSNVSGNSCSCSIPATPPSRFTISSLGSPSFCAESTNESINTRFRKYDYDDSAFMNRARYQSEASPPTSYPSEASSSPFFYRTIPPYLVPSYHSSEDSYNFTDESMCEDEDYATGELGFIEMSNTPPSPVNDQPSIQPTRPGPSIQPTRPRSSIQPTRPGPSIQPTRPGPSIQPTRPVPSIQPTRPGPAIQPTRPVGVKADSLIESGVFPGATTSPRSTSFAGKGMFDRSGMAQAKFEPWVEANTSWRKEDDSSIFVGPHLDMDASDYDFSDPERRELGFDPFVHTYAMKDLASPYKDFAPCAASTPPDAPKLDKKHKNAWKYHSLVGEEEESFWKARTPRPPCITPTSPKHKRLNPSTAADDSATTEGIRHVLGDMEHMEMSKIKKDLRDFQKARRRLIFDATHIRPMP